MEPKIGRPKTDNPNDLKLSVRINAELNKRLNAHCKQHKTTKGEMVRKGLELVLDK